MSDPVNRILDALPAPIKDIGVAILLWSSCEYGAGNAVAGMIARRATPDILDRAAVVLQLRGWKTGKRSGVTGVLQLIEHESECPLIQPILRQLLVNSLSGYGTPVEFNIYCS